MYTHKGNVSTNIAPTDMNGKQLCVVADTLAAVQQPCMPETVRSSQIGLTLNEQQQTWNRERISKCFFMSVPSTWVMAQLRDILTSSLLSDCACNVNQSIN